MIIRRNDIMTREATMLLEFAALLFLVICILHSICKKFFVKNNDDDNYINYDKNKRRRR
jgi:hypothetical protein